MMRALPLALSAATRDVRGVFRRARRNAALMLISGICFGTAYLAALVAAGAYLAPIYGPVMAALLIAASMAGIGIVIIIVLKVLKYIEKRRHARRNAATRLSAAAAISILPQITGSKGLLVVAALGGLAYLVAQGQGGEE